MTGTSRFTLDRRALDDGRTLRMELRSGAERIRWGEALARFRQDLGYIDAFVAALAAAPFEAFLWETPPVSSRTLAQPFEWVLVRNDSLARARADDVPFAQHVRGSRGIRVFENLGGDARLVVPCAEGAPDAYPHLAAFVRRAPPAQVRALWQETALAVGERLRSSSAPCWVSTSGLGVFWVHVRIDERPKYYAHEPYRDPEWERDPVRSPR